ncbi:alpha/beta fold hydrolase [Patescibacteria group bacterium]|nr:alpha/beta fold hydrolase [Patescibacteria group bacterium]
MILAYMLRTWLAGVLLAVVSFLSPAVPQIKQIAPLPLKQYTFANLHQREFKPSSINITQKIKDGQKYSVWEFWFNSDGKKASGTINLPAGVATTSAFTKPAIVMLHGFVDGDYYPGYGTEHLAAVLAQNGFVTFAPDYLGYGSSDKPSADVFEERFQTYTVTLNLIASVRQYQKNLGLWGHSNGGQIALSVLEISGQNIPTVLWAPVSKPFPYNILFYTDTFDDQGKTLRRELAQFEQNYDVEDYSTPNFFDWLNAPIMLQQGSADTLVPQGWSDQLSQTLKGKKKDVTYKVYSGNDHNMLPGWDKAAQDAVNFFKKTLSSS